MNTTIYTLPLRHYAGLLPEPCWLSRVSYRGGARRLESSMWAQNYFEKATLATGLAQKEKQEAANATSTRAQVTQTWVATVFRSKSAGFPALRERPSKPPPQFAFRPIFHLTKTTSRLGARLFHILGLATASRGGKAHKDLEVILDMR